MTLAALLTSDYDFKVVRSPNLVLVWPARGGWPHTLGQGTVAMARALDEIVRLDRRAGSGHIPKDSTAADGLIRASSIFAIATVGRVWSW